MLDCLRGMLDCDDCCTTDMPAAETGANTPVATHDEPMGHLHQLRALCARIECGLFKVSSCLAEAGDVKRAT